MKLEFILVVCLDGSRKQHFGTAAAEGFDEMEDFQKQDLCVKTINNMVWEVIYCGVLLVLSLKTIFGKAFTGLNLRRVLNTISIPKDISFSAPFETGVLLLLET